MFIKKIFNLRNRIIIEEKKYIKLGKNYSIGENTVLSGYKGGLLKVGDNVTICRFCKIATCGGTLIIGNNVQIGDYYTITAQGGVFIEDNVLMADKISIIANQHNYKNIDIPIMNQGEISKSIHIKNGTWIGINVTILQGITIGKNCVIGANSVVTKDISDFSVVAGVPAKVIKYYDEKLQRWIKT